jgi:hypothetical protein
VWKRFREGWRRILRRFVSEREPLDGLGPSDPRVHPIDREGDEDDECRRGGNIREDLKSAAYFSFLHTAERVASSAFGDQQPFQAVGYLSGGTKYYLAITKTSNTNKSDPGPKTHQLALYTDLDGAGSLTGKYFHASPLDVPTIYGHPAAANAIACAAYLFDASFKKPYQPQVEYYTSPGPVTIYFDQYGNRRKYPETRLKPEVAGVDGIATTFFGQPYENAEFAFFGTSAAAPHVAGVAALVLQAAGGPKSIDPTTIKAVLEGTTPIRDTDPLYASGLAGSPSGFVALSAQGEASDGPNFYTINYYGPAGRSLQSITLDGSKAGLIYNTNSPSYPPEIGKTIGIDPSAATIVPNPGTGSPTVTIDFKPGTFTSGVSFSFRVRPYVKLAGGFYGLSADSSAGVTFTARFGSKFADAHGTLQNQYGFGYNQADGFGLIDAVNAASVVLPSSNFTGSAPIAANPTSPGRSVIPIHAGRD